MSVLPVSAAEQDYNNDKATTLADVRSVFTEAAARMKR